MVVSVTDVAVVVVVVDADVDVVVDVGVVVAEVVGVVDSDVVAVDVWVVLPHAFTTSFPAMCQLSAAFNAATPEAQAPTGKANTAPMCSRAVWSLLPARPAFAVNFATRRSISNDAVRPLVRSLRTVKVPFDVDMHCTVAVDAADAAVPSIVLKQATSSSLRIFACPSHSVSPGTMMLPKRLHPKRGHSGVVVGVVVMVVPGVAVPEVVAVEVTVLVAVDVGVGVGHVSHMCGHKPRISSCSSPSHAGSLNSNQHSLGSRTPLQLPRTEGYVVVGVVVADVVDGVVAVLVRVVVEVVSVDVVVVVVLVVAVVVLVVLLVVDVIDVAVAVVLVSVVTVAVVLDTVVVVAVRVEVVSVTVVTVAVVDDPVIEVVEEVVVREVDVRVADVTVAVVVLAVVVLVAVVLVVVVLAVVVVVVWVAVVDVVVDMVVVVVNVTVNVVAVVDVEDAVAVVVVLDVGVVVGVVLVVGDVVAVVLPQSTPNPVASCLSSAALAMQPDNVVASVSPPPPAISLHPFVHGSSSPVKSIAACCTPSTSMSSVPLSVLTATPIVCQPPSWMSGAGA